MQVQLTGGSSLRTPMPYEAFLALGETKHDEYYDGMHVVNPPSGRHVLATKLLGRLLDEHCPPDLTTYPEWGWLVAAGTDLRPDLMVAPLAAARDTRLRVPPLLVVEIQSPSTRDVDQGRKRELYGAGGAAWYWLVDLDAPAVFVHRNDGGVLAEVQRIGAGGAVAVGPFEVVVDPAALVVA
jgi:Uma2 family endonuclease